MTATCQSQPGESAAQRRCARELTATDLPLHSRRKRKMWRGARDVAGSAAGQSCYACCTCLCMLHMPRRAMRNTSSRQVVMMQASSSNAGRAGSSQASMGAAQQLFFFLFVAAVAPTFTAKLAQPEAQQLKAPAAQVGWVDLAPCLPQPTQKAIISPEASRTCPRPPHAAHRRASTAAKQRGCSSGLRRPRSPAPTPAAHGAHRLARLSCTSKQSSWDTCTVPDAMDLPRRLRPRSVWWRSTSGRQ